MNPTTDHRAVIQLSNQVLASDRAPDRLLWGKVGLVFLIPLLLACAGVTEFHLGSHEISAILFGWAEKIFAVLIGVLAGESLSRR